MALRRHDGAAGRDGPAPRPGAALPRGFAGLAGAGSSPARPSWSWGCPSSSPPWSPAGRPCPGHPGAAGAPAGRRRRGHRRRWVALARRARRGPAAQLVLHPAVRHTCRSSRPRPGWSRSRSTSRWPSSSAATVDVAARRTAEAAARAGGGRGALGAGRRRAGRGRDAARTSCYQVRARLRHAGGRAARAARARRWLDVEVSRPTPLAAPGRGCAGRPGRLRPAARRPRARSCSPRTSGCCTLRRRRGDGPAGPPAGRSGRPRPRSSRPPTAQRTALLAGVGHDLRTPLAADQGRGEQPAPARRPLDAGGARASCSPPSRTAPTGSTRLVANLLDACAAAGGRACRPSPSRSASTSSSAGRCSSLPAPTGCEVDVPRRPAPRPRRRRPARAGAGQPPRQRPAPRPGHGAGDRPRPRPSRQRSAARSSTTAPASPPTERERLFAPLPAARRPTAAARRPVPAASGSASRSRAASPRRWAAR